MLREILEKAKLDYQERGAEWGPLRRRIRVLHREYSVRKKLFGNDLSPLFRDIGLFLAIMSRLGLLERLPRRYHLRLSREDIIYLRSNPDAPIPSHIKRSKGTPDRSTANSRQVQSRHSQKLYAPAL
jgi:hypothetical protein